MKRDANGNFPVIESMRNKADELVNAYMDTHSKVLAFRMDLRFPSDYGVVTDNSAIAETLKKTAQSLKRKGNDPAYICIAEQHLADHPHYHLFVLENGHKTQAWKQIADTAEKHWKTTIGSDLPGLVDYCFGTEENPHENGKIFTRAEGIPEYVNRQLDYICKTEDKGARKDGKRDFMMSRLGRFKKK